MNQYAYDYLNRMTQVTQAGQTGGNAVAEKRVDFSYDAEDKSQFTSIDRYADLAGTELVATSTYGYDNADRLTSLDHVDGTSTSLAGYGLSYDAGNRLTGFTVAGYSAEDATYSYDDTDQLTGADRSGTSSDETYSYDENGNRTLTGYSTGDTNQLLSDGTFNYTYDDEGNRTSKTNISTGEVTEYAWDYRNRLTSITTKDSLGVVTKQVDYTYDIFNRRIAKSIDADGAGSGTATEEIYIYDGLRDERDGAGDHILLAFDGSGDLTDRYLYGPNVDQILAGEEVTSTSAAGDVLWPLTDHLGTVRDLATYDDATDTTTIANHIAYDAYGRTLSETNAAVDFLFGFTGRERDAESDLQYNRARYYDAATGRWVSQDPIGFTAGDANLYRYVGNGPALAVDPAGTQDGQTVEPDGGTDDGIYPVLLPDGRIGWPDDVIFPVLLPDGGIGWPEDMPGGQVDGGIDDLIPLVRLPDGRFDWPFPPTGKQKPWEPIDFAEILGITPPVSINVSDINVARKFLGLHPLKPGDPVFPHLYPAGQSRCVDRGPAYRIEFDWHYDRNIFNFPPSTEQEAKDLGWIVLPPEESIYHRHGDGQGNVKYHSPDHRMEAVYDEDGKLVTSPANKGTYNYGTSLGGHAVVDVFPYWIWGNCEEDPVPIHERVLGPDPSRLLPSTPTVDDLDLERIIEQIIGRPIFPRF